MKINKRAKPRIIQIDENVPMIVIDDYYADPDSVRESALEGRFSTTAAGYPGRHEKLDPIADLSVAKVLNNVRNVAEVGSGIAIDIDQIMTDFSILTTPKEKVLKSQSHPHTDGTVLAGLIYLNKKSFGGTCFYRNLRLNSSTILDSNRELYAKIESDYDNNFKDVSGYISNDYDMWELIHKTEGQYNQFVMYPGNVFHSIDVVENPDPSQPKLARLTQRFFISLN